MELNSNHRSMFLFSCFIVILSIGNSIQSKVPYAVHICWFSNSNFRNRNNKKKKNSNLQGPKDKCVIYGAYGIFTIAFRFLINVCFITMNMKYVIILLLFRCKRGNYIF